MIIEPSYIIIVLSVYLLLRHVIRMIRSHRLWKKLTPDGRLYIEQNHSRRQMRQCSDE